MAIGEIAAQHADRQVSLGRRTAQRLGQLWRRVDPANIAASWRASLQRAIAILATSQATAAASSGIYLDDVLGEYRIPNQPEGRIQPGAFAGVASDGRDIAGLLFRPAVTALEQIGGGVQPDRALASGGFLLDMIARTQVADAGRVADGVAITARPQLTGYVRMLVGNSCARCIILAGRVYEWNDGFERHPRCDCRHVPVAEDVRGDIRTDPRAYFDSLSEEEQDAAFGEAGAQAIRDGADMARVVNARRGMATVGESRTRVNAAGQVVNESIRRQTTRRVAGRDVFVTTEAAGRRPRLMPEQIYRDAEGSRDEALRLLRLHGYIR